MSQKPASPLEIPELLAMILFYVDQRTLVRSAVLVNKRWLLAGRHLIIIEYAWSDRLLSAWNLHRALTLLPWMTRLQWHTKFHGMAEPEDNRKQLHLFMLTRALGTIDYNEHIHRTDQDSTDLYFLEMQKHLQLQHSAGSSVFSSSMPPPIRYTRGPRVRLREFELTGDVEFPMLRLLLPLFSFLRRLKVSCAHVNTDDDNYPRINIILKECRHLQELELSSTGHEWLPGPWIPFSQDPGSSFDNDSSDDGTKPPLSHDSASSVVLRSLVLETMSFNPADLEELLGHAPHLKVLRIVKAMTFVRRSNSVFFDHVPLDSGRFRARLQELSLPLEAFHLSINEKVYDKLMMKLCPASQERTFGTNEFTPKMVKTLFQQLNAVTTLKITPDRCNIHTILMGPLLHNFLCSSPHLLHLKVSKHLERIKIEAWSDRQLCTPTNLGWMVESGRSEAMKAKRRQMMETDWKPYLEVDGLFAPIEAATGGEKKKRSKEHFDWNGVDPTLREELKYLGLLCDVGIFLKELDVPAVCGGGIHCFPVLRYSSICQEAEIELSPERDYKRLTGLEATTPFGNPEILDRILSYVDQRALVHGAILVSHQWLLAGRKYVVVEYAWSDCLIDYEKLRRALRMLPWMRRLQWFSGSQEAMPSQEDFWHAKYHETVASPQSQERYWLVLLSAFEMNADNEGIQRRSYDQEDQTLYDGMKRRWAPRITKGPAALEDRLTEGPKSRLRELDLDGWTQVSRFRLLLPYLSSLVRLRLVIYSHWSKHTEGSVPLRLILQDCPCLEDFDLSTTSVEEKLPGPWIPLRTDSGTISDTHFSSLPLRSLAMHRMFFDQDDLEALLVHTPHLKAKLHTPMRSAYCGLDTARFSQHIRRLPIRLDSFHFSTPIESYDDLAMDLCPGSQCRTFRTENFTPTLVKTLSQQSNVVTTLDLFLPWDRHGRHLFGSELHDYLCSSPHLLHLKALDIIYTVEHMDLHGRLPTDKADAVERRFRSRNPDAPLGNDTCQGSGSHLETIRIGKFKNLGVFTDRNLGWILESGRTEELKAKRQQSLKATWRYLENQDSTKPRAYRDEYSDNEESDDDNVGEDRIPFDWTDVDPTLREELRGLGLVVDVKAFFDELYAQAEDGGGFRCFPVLRYSSICAAGEIELPPEWELKRLIDDVKTQPWYYDKRR
ncbi:hypothetical protein BGX29_005508 [Mortierella sp. GBA35]|nr:hypothetical protein BGX29_005508 [Mortierella sp. GBA35]